MRPLCFFKVFIENYFGVLYTNVKIFFCQSDLVGYQLTLNLTTSQQMLPSAEDCDQTPVPPVTATPDTDLLQPLHLAMKKKVSAAFVCFCSSILLNIQQTLQELLLLGVITTTAVCCFSFYLCDKKHILSYNNGRSWLTSSYSPAATT
jgi:hypothetical protein